MSGLDIMMAMVALPSGAYACALAVVAGIEAGRWLAGRLRG
jgi:hypothetical protein